MENAKQLQLNVECILDSYLNGMYDYPEEYPKLTKDECRQYVIEQVYDLKDYGNGHTKYRKGICDNLRFLGNDYIYSIIDKYAEENGILK